MYLSIFNGGEKLAEIFTALRDVPFMEHPVEKSNISPFYYHFQPTGFEAIPETKEEVFITVDETNF